MTIKRQITFVMETPTVPDMSIGKRVDIYFPEICLTYSINASFYFQLLYLVLQFFQNALVTWNKMVQRDRNHFLAQCFVPFYDVVCSILYPVLASKPIEMN